MPIGVNLIAGRKEGGKMSERRADRKVTNRFTQLLLRKMQRDGKRISNREVARSTGLSTLTVNDYANNKVTRFDATVLTKLCDYLDCSLDELLVIEDDETPEWMTPQLA